MPAETSSFVSRYPTRIHRLEIAGAHGSGGGAVGVTTVIDLVAPVNPDALLDDPITEQRYKADNYFPYWPIIWPSGLMMASRILTSDATPPTPPTADARCIELGCGLGITGITAGQRGWNVMFTDYDSEAVLFAHHNALRNGVPAERVRSLHMDWRSPVDEKFPWVIASDVLYERRLHPLLLTAIQAMLAPGGVAWVSDPQRTSAEDFPIAAVEHGFKVFSENLEGKNFAGGVQPGTLFILTRAK